MPVVHPWQTSFTSGELTDQLDARTDWDRYRAGAAYLENWLCRPYGGIARRAGLSFLGPAATQTARGRLIDFRVSTAVSYVLELSPGTMRVWHDRALVPGAVLATPWVNEADLRAIHVAQSADVMYLCHLSYPVQKLSRTSPSTFVLAPVVWDCPPTVEQGITPPVALTLSATSGTGVTVAASAGYWNAGDPNRHIRSGVGLGVITSVVSPTVALMDVLEVFPSATLAAGAWTLEDSPQVTLVVTYQDPVLNLNLAAVSGSGILAAVAKTGDPLPSAFWTAGDVGLILRAVGMTGRAVIQVVQSATYILVDIYETFAAASMGAGQWEIEGSSKGALQPMVHIIVKDGLAGFHPEEMTGYLRLLGGVVEIRTATATEVTGRLVSPFTPDTRLIAPPGAWSRELPAWSVSRGYPGAACFSQSRLWFAGSLTQPDTIWGSATGDYEQFALGPDDDDAIEYALAGTGMNLIRWLKGIAAGSTSGLAAGTVGGEITLEGGQEAPLTPSNVRARERTYYGADLVVDALQTNNLVLFLQRGGQRIREFTFALAQDSYVAPDLTLAAEHLSRRGLVELAHANSPDSIIFALTSDGLLLSCAYERPEQIVAWSHHRTAGVFESVCVVPNACGTGDEVWVLVNRGIAGEVRRSVEVFDGRLNTDAALVYEGAATGSFSGLQHLAGAPVKAIDQDDNVFDLTVPLLVDDPTGTITLPDGATATRLEVGLHFTCTLETLRPELMSPEGTAQARRKHWNYVVARLYCTKSRFVWNGDLLLEYPEGVDPHADYTGDSARLTQFGWTREGVLSLQTLDPLPATVLGLTGAIQVDDP